MCTTTLRSCSDKFQQFAGWGANSAGNRLALQLCHSDKYFPHANCAEDCKYSSMQFLEKLSSPLCNDSARVETVQITVGVRNCFSVGPPILGPVGHMPDVVHFFDKVVDVPFVLCDGIPQVQFIEGYDVPMVMRAQRSAPHLPD